MTGPMLIGSVAEACEFVKDWCGVDRDYPWRAPPASPRPEPLVALGNRLGAIWDGDEHPYWTLPDQGHSIHLYAVQERFFDPREETPVDGVTYMIEENQGVNALGYRAADDPQLYVRGDWIGEDRGDHWRPAAGATVEDALILFLLGNLFWLTYPTVGSDEEWALAPGPRDAATDVCLFTKPDWGFDGLFTNASSTVLHFSGHDLTIAKPAPLTPQSRA